MVDKYFPTFNRAAKKTKQAGKRALEIGQMDVGEAAGKAIKKGVSAGVEGTKKAAAYDVAPFIKKSVKTIGPIIIILVVAIFLLYFAFKWIIGVAFGAGGGIPSLLNTGWTLLIILLAIEFWIWFSVSKRSGWSGKIMVLLAIILLLITLFAWQFYMTMPGQTPEDKFGGIKTRIENVWGVINPFAKIKAYQTRYEAALVGDYFTGRVDKTKDEPLGVYLEDIKQADPYFYVGEPVTIWATLRAKILDDTITVILSCKAKTALETKPVPGNITPEDNFTIDIAEEEYIECNFKSLSEGTHKITFDADFNFETMAYFKQYFIDKIRLRSMIREGVDILGQYGIKDKNPVAVYSNGPIGIGMETKKNQPIGINIQEPGYITLGITLENRWQGGLKNIKTLEIKVPEGFNMRGLNCQAGKYWFTEHACTKKDAPIPNCEEGYNLYQLTNLRSLSRVEDFTSMRCTFDITNPTRILGTTPVATKYFKVMTKYDYRLNKSITVSVRKLKTDGLLPAISKNEIMDKVISEAKIQNIPIDLALALAEQESNFISSTTSKAGAIGIMQIMPWPRHLNTCGITAQDLYDINKNIECGMKIFKNCFNAYSDNKELYETSVNTCTITIHRNKYLDYTGWNRALRAYNGFGCITIPERNIYSDTNFVENVNNRKSKFAGYT